MKELAEEIGRLCREYWDCCIEAEKREEGRETRRKLEQFCRNIRGKLEIAESKVLLAVMDAYEITRDEGMLQEVLDVVSGNIDRLEVSAEAVKLLAYCYYYVEEEECAVKARKMLEQLRRREGEEEELAEVEKMLEEWVV